MVTFIIKRIIIAFPLLLCVAFLSFLLIQLAPGDYFDTLKTNPLISKETIEKFKTTYHLDKPIITQFFYWIKNIFTGDFGFSYVRNAPVSAIIGQYAINTLLLALTALTLTWLLAIPLGMISAIKRNTSIDRSVSVLSLIIISFPSFIVAIILLYVFSSLLGIPTGGMKSLNFDSLLWYEQLADIIKHLIVPTLAISLLSMSSLIRITRANMLDELKKPYILNEYARGLQNTTIYKHALRNALNPLITILGYEFSALLSGSAIIEIICNWPGLGSVLFEAVLNQDLFLVMGGIIISSFMLIIGNLLADILLAWNDPRIKLSPSGSF